MSATRIRGSRQAGAGARGTVKSGLRWWRACLEPVDDALAVRRRRASACAGELAWKSGLGAVGGRGERASAGRQDD